MVSGHASVDRGGMAKHNYKGPGQTDTNTLGMDLHSEVTGGVRRTRVVVAARKLWQRA